MAREPCSTPGPARAGASRSYLQARPPPPPRAWHRGSSATSYMSLELDCTAAETKDVCEFECLAQVAASKKEIEFRISLQPV